MENVHVFAFFLPKCVVENVTMSFVTLGVRSGMREEMSVQQKSKQIIINNKSICKQNERQHNICYG